MTEILDRIEKVVDKDGKTHLKVHTRPATFRDKATEKVIDFWGIVIIVTLYIVILPLPKKWVIHMGRWMQKIGEKK